MPRSSATFSTAVAHVRRLVALAPHRCGAPYGLSVSTHERIERQSRAATSRKLRGLRVRDGRVDRDQEAELDVAVARVERRR